MAIAIRASAESLFIPPKPLNLTPSSLPSTVPKTAAPSPPPAALPRHLPPPSQSRSVLLGDFLPTQPAQLQGVAGVAAMENVLQNYFWECEEGSGGCDTADSPVHRRGLTAAFDPEAALSAKHCPALKVPQRG
jgi:hypothetical protein